MTSSVKFLLVSTILLSCGSAISQPTRRETLDQSPKNPNAPVSLTITAVRNPVDAGSEVNVKIVERNISPHEITLGCATLGSFTGWTFRVEVQDRHGKQPPFTRFGQRLRGLYTPADLTLETPTNGNIAWVKLKPGESRESELDISKLYNLSEPGKYTIRIRRFYDNGRIWVKSNKIAITVRP